MNMAFSSELRWLFHRVRPYLGWHIASLITITLGSLLALVDPLILKWLIDDILPRRDLHLLIIAVGVIFLSYEGRILLTSLGNFFTFHASQKMVLSIRMHLFDHINRLSADYHEKTPVGAKLYLLNDPSEEIALLGADLFPSALRTMLLTLFIVATMLILNSSLTLAVLPLVPIFLLVRHRFRRRLGEAADSVQNKQSAVSSFLQEHLASVIQVQLLRQERRQARRAVGYLTRAIRARYRLWQTAILFTVLSGSIIALAITAVMAYGGQKVLGGTFTIGGLVAFYSYLVRLFDPLSGAVELYSRLQRVSASVRKILELLDTKLSVRESPNAEDLPVNVPGDILFTDVSFGYQPGRDLLQIPSLHIRAGERVALVGSNGAGKSTLAKLIARLYDPRRGSILIAGKNVREITLKSLRSAVCYMPQHTVLFDCSLEDNLRFGNPWASDHELLESATAVGLEKVISGFPESWQQSLGPEGKLLSGGERQRVAIARAILQRPGVLILDEATSSLDGPVEKHVLQTLDRTLPDSTLVFISHRYSTVSWVDRIILLQDGRVIDQGNHRELYRKNGLYTRLFDEQGVRTHSLASPGN